MSHIKIKKIEGKIKVEYNPEYEPNMNDYLRLYENCQDIFVRNSPSPEYYNNLELWKSNCKILEFANGELQKLMESICGIKGANIVFSDKEIDSIIGNNEYISPLLIRLENDLAYFIEPKEKTFISKLNGEKMYTKQQMIQCYIDGINHVSDVINGKECITAEQYLDSLDKK